MERTFHLVVNSFIGVTIEVPNISKPIKDCRVIQNFEIWKCDKTNISAILSTNIKSKKYYELTVLAYNIPRLIG